MEGEQAGSPLWNKMLLILHWRVFLLSSFQDYSKRISNEKTTVIHDTVSNRVMLFAFATELKKGIILLIVHIFSRPVPDRPVHCCRCRRG